jgi:3-keto-5-aminohexanoate cleavage enzyme
LQIINRKTKNMEKLIITAAICGAEVTKEQNPAVPYTVEEIVREAKSAVDAGAAIVHLHVREDDGTPTQSRARFQECEDAIYKACPNVILIPSTGGAVGMTPDERLQSTDTTPIPEMATLDCGTCNFGDEIFDNTMPTMRAFGKRMIERGIKPEYECFEMGHLDTILTMARKGEVPGAPMQFNFVLGVPGCTPATVDNLCWLVKNIPAGSTWTSTGIGRHAFTLAAPTIVMGGNVRVGFEDNLYLERGVLAKSNGELVDKVVRMAKLLGRPIATSDEAREILGLKKR